MGNWSGGTNDNGGGDGRAPGASPGAEPAVPPCAPGCRGSDCFRGCSVTKPSSRPGPHFIFFFTQQGGRGAASGLFELQPHHSQASGTVSHPYRGREGSLRNPPDPPPLQAGRPRTAASARCANAFCPRAHTLYSQVSPFRLRDALNPCVDLGTLSILLGPGGLLGGNEGWSWKRPQVCEDRCVSAQTCLRITWDGARTE